jgi:elongation factor 2
MDDRENVRNIGIVAHVDHGKTTLADSLLAAAGLLPSQVAGKARALDYLEEEQKRGITIKTANIALFCKIEGKSFVVNLVDTPGHVDFTGKVARALRAIDGVVVVVDAVEEILAQTETVTRQALNERVKPILFINKVDRLVEELKLTPEQVQDRFARIVTDFNNILESYSEAPFRKRWKVSPAQESVAFGSALDRWGTTTHLAREKGITFSHIMQAYKNNDQRKLARLLPLQNTVLRIVVRNLPNPVEAQGYRIPKIWKGDTSTRIGKAMLNCDSNGPTAMCVTNVQVDSEGAVVCTGRIFSGKIKPNDRIYLVGVQEERATQGVYVHMGASREAATRISAGNIVALTGLETAKAGETAVEVSQKDEMVPFERLGRVSYPVITIVVEPTEPSELERVTAAMGTLAIEDPDLRFTFSGETSEYLLGGMGELHLEIAVKSLQEHIGGAGITVSEPLVSYRETITKAGKVLTSRTADGKIAFSIQDKPLVGGKIKLLEKERSILRMENLLAAHEYGNAFFGMTGETVLSAQLKKAITSGFEWACEAGPLCGQPLTRVQVDLINAEIVGSSTEFDATQVSRAVSRAIFGSFLTANPRLLEPVYRFELSTPIEMLGRCSNIIARRRGKITSSEPRGLAYVVTGFLPVAETFGLAAQLRSATSGRAFWQLYFDRWEEMSREREIEVMTRIRRRKGLRPEVPSADTFAEMML